MDLECCKDSCCSHSLVAAATREAQHLSAKEKEAILKVLYRNELLQQEQERKVQQLKAELHALRLKGVIKVGSTDQPDPDRSCGRCRVELGRVINRGALCRACRLRVCKNCREYSFQTTDWVCSVCYKNMEIQAASGEWMNEFVRRPSRRRDSKEYMPSANLVRKSIRRSWTISNPIPHWNTSRDSPEMRKYNSLPKSQGIHNYPSLQIHQRANRSPSPVQPIRHETNRSPARRAHSEDVYSEKSEPIPLAAQEKPIKTEDEPKIDPVTKRHIRVNPLIKYASTKKHHCCKPDGTCTESATTKPFTFSLKTKQKSEEKKDETNCEDKRTDSSTSHSEDSSLPEVNFAREESGTTEVFDIEPFTGTVFRKVSVRRRRQEMKKVPAVDSGWRKSAEADLLDISMPEGDEYKLVFLSSDSSSKEEDPDDNDSSSTASSFPVEDCDWDYFEPGSNARSIRFNSPFGSPRVYRRTLTDSPLGSPLVFRRTRDSETGTDDDIPTHVSSASSDSLNFQLKSNDDLLESRMDDLTNYQKCSHKEEVPQKAICHNCGASSTQYVYPILVPVTIPIPMQNVWPHDYKYSNELVEQAMRNKLRALPRNMWPYLNQSGLIWPVMTMPHEQNANTNTNKHQNTTTTGTSTSEDHVDSNKQTREKSSEKQTEHKKLSKRRSHDNEETQHPNHLHSENLQFSSSDSCSSSDEGNWEDSVPKLISLRSTNKEIDEPSNKSYKSTNKRLDRGASSDDVDEAIGSSSEILAKNSDDDSKAAEARQNENIVEARNRHLSQMHSKKICRRVYNISGGDRRESDDALPSSELSDCDEQDEDKKSQSSVKEDDTTSSSSGSGETDTDDTGTVPDRKTKKFSKIFVVNEPNKLKNATREDEAENHVSNKEREESVACTCNSSLLNSSTSSNSSRNTSDNDTDGDEVECGVILTKMRQISDEDCDGTVILKGVKYTDSDSLINDNNDKLTNDGKITNDNFNKINSSFKDIINSTADFIRNECKELLSDNIKIENGSIRKLNTSDSDVVENGSLADSLIKCEIIDGSEKGVGNEQEIADERLNECDVTDNEYIVHEECEESSDTEESPSRVEKWGRRNWAQGSDKNSEINKGKSEESGARAAVTHGRSALGEQPQTGSGSPVVEGGKVEPGELEADSASRHAAKYTSLVMITQESQPSAAAFTQVSVVTSDTTTLVPGGEVIVQHTNWQEQDNWNNEKWTEENPDSQDKGLSNYFTLTLENSTPTPTPRRPRITKMQETPDKTPDQLSNAEDSKNHVTVVTGGDTLSAVVCLEEGLADDDSWVENLSHDEDEYPPTSPEDSSSGEEITLTCSAALDNEDELRGYHRAAIDFTLHTIVEESCEESEVEHSPQEKNKNKQRPTSATDLEKYFYFGLGEGNNPSLTSNREDTYSETSSIYSEGMDSLGGPDEPSESNDGDPADLASSRLEKYFLSGFMGFSQERRDSDGSVGSDSEGHPSPEQRRKRLVRARGTGRSHSSSLDNLLANPDLNNSDTPQNEAQQSSVDSSSSDSDTYEETNFEKADGQFDTVKRKKCKKKNGNSSPSDGENAHSDTPKKHYDNKDQNKKALESTKEVDESDEDRKTPTQSQNDAVKKPKSRDSGFMGSSDDLLKDPPREQKTPEQKLDQQNNELEKRLHTKSTPPATSLTRKDSFNNWSSDEETNLMMTKMRQFFKTLVAGNNPNYSLRSTSNPNSKPNTPVLGLKHDKFGHGRLGSGSKIEKLDSPSMKVKNKPPQLVYFENELTRLMKTVPGIRDDQVREIVEYLSSEDTWSDSYDSSDYTSSDLEGSVSKSVLQQQISDSCKEIIDKFDKLEDDVDEETSKGLNKETAFVYQKLVASFEKMAVGENGETGKSSPHSSPPIIAKVMHHIGSRLVALMHEVSSGESHASNSPRVRHYHRRLQQKLSNASTTTTEDDDSTSDTNLQDKLSALETVTPYNLLPRSKSHDLLLGESRGNQSAVSDATEEREVSDCERFSWRGSFESALLATDSRTKLSMLSGEHSNSASALALAAKRRSAGDLLFSHKSFSREQLDRVRSCGSIGGATSEDKLWVSSASRPSRRRSSVPDASCGSGGSADGEDDDEELESRSTLPRSLQTTTATTNSLPRLPTNNQSTNIQKAQSMYHFLQQNVKSARYRPPGFNRLTTTTPKRAVSAPGLQPSHQRRGRRSQQSVVPSDDASLSEAHSSPMLASRSSKSATPSPVALSSRRGTGSSQEWPCDDDIDRLVTLHNRSSLSSLGLRSDSMASVYSGAGEGRYGTVAVKGQVEFGLQYNYKASALEIMIKQCKDLASVDTKRNRSDPYVKVYLLPDKSKSGKRKTKVKKHTLNPVFDECLKFHVSLNELEKRTLWLTVWHSDMFGRNDFLGEVMMTLGNKVFDDPTPKLYNLQERVCIYALGGIPENHTEPFEDVSAFKGDILVGLKFVPPDMTVIKKGRRSRGALHVLIKEAKALTAVKANGTSDPFCKSYLLPEKGRSSKQKTSVIKRSVNPVWNHTFVYEDVALQELAERCLELTVWDHDRLASNEFLGGVRFSLGTGKHYGKAVDWMDATGRELSLWKSMLERPNFWVEGCVSLRPTLDYRIT